MLEGVRAPGSWQSCTGQFASMFPSMWQGGVWGHTQRRSQQRSHWGGRLSKAGGEEPDGTRQTSEGTPVSRR